MGQSASRAVRSLRAGLAERARFWARRAGGVDRADQARRASDWDPAIAGYRAYLRGSPRDFGVRMRLIKTLFAAGRLDEAEAEVVRTAFARPDKASLAEVARDIAAARAASVALAEYERFRSETTLPAAPPVDPRLRPLIVLVDARDASTTAIESTLEALRRSIAEPDALILWSSDREDDFPDVLRLEEAQAVEGAIAGAGAVLLLEAGVVMDPEGLGWLVRALSLTGAVAAYGDDDCRFSAEASQGGGPAWRDPAFYAAPHRLDIETCPRLPAAVLLRPFVIGLAQDRRERLLSALELGRVAHVPLLTASLTEARNLTAAPQPVPAARLADRSRILAVIPTRDEGAVLSQMIDSLISHAAAPEKLDIIVVDNGSRDPQTLRLLARLAADGKARVLAVDEPFNWSRLNNLAAAGAEAEILLFANNDMQMRTHGWDDRLRASLAQPGVGVVGARLTYPNGRVQHAGMALGALHGRPVHEGLGSGPEEAGPLARWRRNRPAAAVTGAFMGVRREVFEATGGFNAQEFAVGCNDIDFCLRSRALGWTVVYAADLELVHWESHSRGHDDTEAKRRRAEAELAALDRLWGAAARRDPSRNPHWVNHETLLFHGLRQPDAAEAEAWILESITAWGQPVGPV